MLEQSSRIIKKCAFIMPNYFFTINKITCLNKALV